MSRLIDDLLLLARSDAGIDVLELEPVLLADPLREAVVKAEALALTRNIRLRAEIPVAPAVSGHTASLQRLFFALIENAVHYTPEGGEVDVTVVTEDGKATVIIRDSGPGIAAEDLAHIFERFYRADKSRTRQSGGTGLGLPIARRIAALHRGTITVSSSTSGSEFRVLLPLSSQRR